MDSSFNTCQICSATTARVVMPLPRFDLLRCPACTHLFSRLKVESETYGSEYFLESNAEHWDNPDITLFDELDAMFRKHYSGDLTGHRSLDVGSATGYLTRRFGELGYESWGIDISEAAVKYGTEQLGIPRLVATQLEDFNPPAPFPAITSLYVIEHVTDPISFLTNVRRILSDDGVFICMTVDSSSIFFRWAEAIFKLSGGRSYSAIERVCEVHHLHHFNRLSLDEALKQTGFQVIHRFSRNLPLNSVTLNPLQKIAVGSMYALSPILNSWFLQGVVCRRSASSF